jgi:hypothetical protein
VTRTSAKTKGNKERGMALLLTLFALLLVSGIGLFMVLSSNTETRIDANYGSSLRSYYAARSGLEEVRDRINHASPALQGGVPGGLGDLLPQDIAGNTGGVLYVLNPANGETIDPTDPTSPYFDDDVCHTYSSGTPKGIKCTTVPTVANWQLAAQFSQAPASGPLGYKWIRINMKTNRIADPYFVDQGPAAAAMVGAGQSGAPLDTPVCWDGQAEQLLPSNGNPTCDANGMQAVYMLTSLAVTSQATGLNGARKLLQAEVVAPSIRPAGVLTASAMNLPTAINGVPPVAIDGRIHNLDGSLFSVMNPDGTPATKNGCSSVAPLATNSGSSQMEQALDLIRKNIVDTANSSCNSDGTPATSCSPGLWWVRGTDLATRFVTSVTTGTSGGSGSSPGGSGHDGGGGSDGDGDHHGPTGVATTACDPTSPSCYTNLDLSAPELFGIASTPGLHLPIITLAASKPAPFVGNYGNQVDATIYQPAAAQTVPNQIAAVNNLVAISQNKGNFFPASSATLNSSYGSSNSPAVVVISDSVLSLQNNASLTGFGVLVVKSLEIDSTSRLYWNGIVLVNSSTGHVTINPGAVGSINGALLLAPGAIFNLSNSSSSSGTPFQITYSCDALDLAFSKLPFKVVSTAETSF